MNKLLTEEKQKEFRNKLSKAFRELRKVGYIAKQNFWCCQSCAWADLPSDAKKVVFYHHQDNDNISEGYVYLAWTGKGSEIRKSLIKAGLDVLWDGKSDKRIRVNYKAG